MQNKQINARDAHKSAPSSPSEVITMLKGMKKHEDKEQGKTLKHEEPRRIIHKVDTDVFYFIISFKLKFNEFHFYKLYYKVFIINKHFEKNVIIKIPSLSGFRMVGQSRF